MLLLLLACGSENELVNKDDVGGGLDTEAPGCPPQIPNCHDTEDSKVDTASPNDTEPKDCEVLLGAAGTVSIEEECQGDGTTGTVTDPYDLTIEYEWKSSASGPVVKPSVINLSDDNGDGRVDENDTPDFVVTVYSTNQLVAVSGDGSGELWTYNGFNGAGDIASADIDADGEVEIVGFSSTNKVIAVDADGNKEWESSASVSNGYPHITTCDLDGDGKPEVIADTLVVDGKTGNKECTLESPGVSYVTPVCADVDQDGYAEIILGNVVADHNCNTLWKANGTGMSNFGAVVDVDGDPEGEIVMATDRLLIFDPDGTELSSTKLTGTRPGPQCAADFDGDGEVEIAVPESTVLTVYDTNGDKVWSQKMQDNSGLAGCSGYDMDGDGAYEVLFADEVALRMYDGASGAILYESFSHNSGTLFEYPVIADLDKDGSSEILVAENLGARMGVIVYGHAGDGWPKSGPTWATHDWAVTNVEPDGSIPKRPEPSWTKYNVFRARPSVDEPAASDLGIAQTDLCITECDETRGKVKVAVQVWNEGAADVEAGVPWTFYSNDGTNLTLVTSGTLPAIPAGTKLEGFAIEVPVTSIGDYGFVIKIDDDGLGAETVDECDEEDNAVEWGEDICG